ncbi:GGDEF domain-containing protein [Azohydromonas sediminis]|uniref:GGDEF domain-containing protein n=1 Tax=Azohydromonas sediminis TaxID=2259674 RepID=UPI000E655C65|nr:GGDEF domain-containing protein [Azohydromonas sediminis]
MDPTTWSAATKDVRSVRELVERRALLMHYQPIVLSRDGSVYGHEALVRTPPGCRWPGPEALFQAARAEGVTEALELACVRAALSGWLAQGARGRLLVNLSAAALLAALADGQLRRMLDLLRAQGVASEALVVELTEHEHVRDVDALVEATEQLCRARIGVALDDFGDGRSSLRLWSQIKPEIVKIDRYFTRDVGCNGDKVQTFRALQQLAETFGAQLVAEGVETAAELRVVRDLGVPLVQGYLLGRPAAQLREAIECEAAQVLSDQAIAVLPQRQRVGNRGWSASRLLIDAPALPVTATHDEVFAAFERRADLPALAIVDADRPCGLLVRSEFIAQYARPFFKELYGRRPAILHANTHPLCLDVHAQVDDLIAVLTSADQRYLSQGFILTEGGRYRGLGTGEQLVRAVTEARIEAARHANPLTFLPGNIPITQHVERLLERGAPFAVAYADLNHFKPYNDHYGYWRGDEMIRLLAQVLLTHVEAERDFVGHVGGDDFVVVFQSGDWQARCCAIVDQFNARARDLFDPDDLAAGGIQAEDRDGVVRFHPCTTLALGVLRIAPGRFRAAEEVANAAAKAKRHAKTSGVGVYVWDADASTSEARSSSST